MLEDISCCNPQEDCPFRQKRVLAREIHKQDGDFVPFVKCLYSGFNEDGCFYEMFFRDEEKKFY